MKIFHKASVILVSLLLLLSACLLAFQYNSSTNADAIRPAYSDHLMPVKGRWKRNRVECDEDTQGWTQWVGWSACSKSCGKGLATNLRHCQTPISHACNKKLCWGNILDNVSTYCNWDSCDADGGWGDWGGWTSCQGARTCQVRIRSRLCDNPPPSGAGKYCEQADSTEELPCQPNGFCPKCYRDGTWTAWSFSACTAVCEGGTKTGRRSCIKPLCGGKSCIGSLETTAACNTGPCCYPRNGGWVMWSSWSSCSATCGGTRSRYRQCSQPTPDCGGLQCSGDDTQTYKCNTQECPACVPVHGEWSSYSSWSSCSDTCGGGTRTRTRECDNPAPACNGRFCEGDGQDSASCNLEECCDDSVHGWSQWSTEDACSSQCGLGSKVMTRQCRGTGSKCTNLCKGRNTNYSDCVVKAAVNGFWSSWTEGQCSATCGSAVKVQTRTCTDPAPNECGQRCPGDSSAFEPCTSLPSCCAAAGSTAADLSINPTNPVIGSDPESEDIAVLVQCQALECPGDTLSNLTLSYSSGPGDAKKLYVSASPTSDGGQAVDHVRLARTIVTGSIRRNSITYMFLKARCEDSGVYECNSSIARNGGSTKMYTKSGTLQVIVTPSKFTLTPRDSPVNMKVGDVLELECSGTVGTMTPDTKIEFEWGYKNRGASTWTKISNPDETKQITALPGNCTTMVEVRVLKLTLTQADKSRKYFCCMKKDGVGCSTNYDNPGTQYSVNIGSKLDPVSKASLQIKPDIVTLQDTKPVQVNISCRGSDSHNKLAALILGFRPSARNITKTRELAIAEEQGSVTDLSGDSGALVSGGLETRSIHYILPRVTCLNTGMYFCTTRTELSSSSKLNTVEGRLEVFVQPNVSTMTSNGIGSNGLGSQLYLHCSTLVLNNPNVKWTWQYTNDPDPKVANWTDVDPTDLDTVVTTKTVKTDDKCFSVPTTTLTISNIKAKHMGRIYRCFVTVGDKVYSERAAYRKVEQEPAKQTGAVSNLQWIIVGIVASVFLLIIFILVVTIAKRMKNTTPSAAHQIRVRQESQPSRFDFFGQVPLSSVDTSEQAGPPIGLLAPTPAPPPLLVNNSDDTKTRVSNSSSLEESLVSIHDSDEEGADVDTVVSSHDSYESDVDTVTSDKSQDTAVDSILSFHEV